MVNSYLSSTGQLNNVRKLSFITSQRIWSPRFWCLLNILKFSAEINLFWEFNLSKYRIELRILIGRPISLSQHGNKERNIGNHLKSIPRVYIILKNKANNSKRNYLSPPKLSQVQQNSNLCRTHGPLLAEKISL